MTVWPVCGRTLGVPLSTCGQGVAYSTDRKGPAAIRIGRVGHLRCGSRLRGAILTTLSITVLSVFLASGATEYGLEGEVPARVANTLEEMMDLASWPATVIVGLLAFVSILVVVGAFTEIKKALLRLCDSTPTHGP